MDNKEVSNGDHQQIHEYYVALWSSKDLDKVYDNYAEDYDRMNNLFEYFGYNKLADELPGCFKGEDIREKLILDAGSGTGLLGKSLAAKGFTKIHALDISQASLDAARKKNVYQEFYCACVTNKRIPDIEDNLYDAIVSSGCFVPNHIKVNAIEELARLTKKDGYIMITLHDDNFEMNYMEELNRLMVRKIVVLQSMKRIPYKRDYSENYEQKFAYLITMSVL